MFDILIQISTVLSQSIYSRADAAIAAMCSIAWVWIMGPLVGLVVGYHVLTIMFDDKKSIADGGRQMLVLFFPLLIMASLITPKGGGCNAVIIKKQSLEARATVTELIAPGFGKTPDALIIESVKAVAFVMSDFINLVGNASAATPPQGLLDTIKAVPGAIASSVNFIILGLTGLIVMLLAAIMSAVVMAHVLIQDFALVLGAIFLPFGIALWPVSKTWAMSALTVMLQAVFASAAFAFFVDILFAKDGALDKGVKAAMAMFPQQASPLDQSLVVISAALAVVAFLVSVIAVAYAIPRILKQIFVRLEFQVLGKP